MAQSRKKSLPVSTSLALPDLKNFKKISQDFLYRENQKAKIYARWELDFLWTRFRAMTVSDLFAIDTNPTTCTLTVSELLIVNQIKYMVRTDNLDELNRVYDRLLGKPKESKEEKVIDDVEFTIDILKSPTEEK